MEGLDLIVQYIKVGNVAMLLLMFLECFIIH